MHEHTILGVNWSGGNFHAHQYSTETTINDGHSHMVQGTTALANNTMEHVHYYEGTTTYVGHVHHFSGYTGRPIYMADGTHYHEFSGTTTFNDGHVHNYSGYTGMNFS